MPAKPTKPCVTCGRTIEWRKKWDRDWDSVKYCSKACRAKGTPDANDPMEQAILDLIATRAGSICPSEAAKAVHPNDWREHMEDARAAARRLVNQHKAVITQKGRPVDPSTAKGPIRIAKP